MNNEVTAVKEAEVVSDVAIATIDKFGTLLKEQDQPILSVIKDLDTLDWRSLKPHQMAFILMQRPMSVSGGVMYLSFKQALYYAVRCYELGVSPFGNDTWFDPNRFSVNLTLEGKRQVAHNKGIQLGPPKFESLARAWTDVPKLSEAAEEAKKAGFTRDIGYKCTIRVGDPKNGETCDYTAWLSEWYVGRSPVWKAKPEHMLQVRSQEKAISMAMGTGSSAFPDEREGD